MGNNTITTTLPTASLTGTNLVSKNYVDNAISTGGGSYLPLSGGTLTGNLVLQKQLFLNNQSAYAMNTNSIYYSGSNIMYTSANFFGNLTGNGVATAVAQSNTNNATRIPRTQITTAYGLYYTSGLIGSSLWYASGSSLYVGMGWSIKFCFGVDLFSILNGKKTNLIG